MDASFQPTPQLSSEPNCAYDFSAIDQARQAARLYLAEKEKGIGSPDLDAELSKAALLKRAEEQYRTGIELLFERIDCPNFVPLMPILELGEVLLQKGKLVEAREQFANAARYTIDVMRTRVPTFRTLQKDLAEVQDKIQFFPDKLEYTDFDSLLYLAKGNLLSKEEQNRAQEALNRCLLVMGRWPDSIAPYQPKVRYFEEPLAVLSPDEIFCAESGIGLQRLHAHRSMIRFMAGTLPVEPSESN